jgi:hypothetical protein
MKSACVTAWRRRTWPPASPEIAILWPRLRATSSSEVTPFNDEQKTLVNIITRESARLNNIISDFLVLAEEFQVLPHGPDSAA